MEGNQPNENALYVLNKSPYGNGVQLVLHVTDTFRKGYVCFDDTNCGHMIQGDITKRREKGFTFIDHQNNEWEFEEVTIEMYRDKLYQFANNGEEVSKICHTTEQLWEYYRNEFPI